VIAPVDFGLCAAPSCDSSLVLKKIYNIEPKKGILEASINNYSFKSL
jgi:hypothetical protein